MISQNNLNKHKQKAKELVSKMSLTEKISQLRHHSKALKKYNIPEYNWWNECLHGVARAGIATVFPQAIALAATFCEDIMFKVGDIISTEARAKHHEFVRNGQRGIYQGLTFWSPNINIFRDPRWGRGQETYGEDPYLTSLLGVSFINGLQGDNDKYLKVSACAKHYAVHSGPESERHYFDARVSKKDMYETYLPAFEAAVKQANVESVMTAYNRVNGEACPASEVMLNEILRGKWQFDGHTVSDCGGVADIINNHKITRNPIKGVALALAKGLDLECGVYYSLLYFAVKLKYAKVADVDRALIRLLTTRSKLAMFDDDCEFSNIPASKIACEEHENFAIEVAQKSIVLLQNKNDILPLKVQKINSACLLGANAVNEIAYLGNYCGTPSKFINAYNGIEQVLQDKLTYEKTIPLAGKLTDNISYSNGLDVAKRSDIVFITTGLDSTMEGEAGDTGAGLDGIIGLQGDRNSINLPQIQIDLINDVASFGKKIVILNFSGSCINFTPILDKVEAILQCWYPGAMGGKAIANILFGTISPSGKLPITFYASDNDLPDFRDYSMINRTYRYLKSKPLYPFGYGLSYTNFKYSNVSSSSNEMDDNIKLSVDITNTGNYDGDEVAQVYLSYPSDYIDQPIVKLIKTKRLFIKQSSTSSVHFELNKSDFYAINDKGEKILLQGAHTISIGGGQPNFTKTLSLVINSN